MIKNYAALSSKAQTFEKLDVLKSIMKTHFKNTLLLALFVVNFSTGFSQKVSFEEVLPPLIANFDDVNYSSIAFADVNNDNVMDVLITGQNSSNQRPRLESRTDFLPRF